jgi:hypothetical protein
VSSSHSSHKSLSEKLDELKGAEARYFKDLTLCQAKVNEFQISETKCESLYDESIVVIMLSMHDKFVVYELTTSKSISCSCGIFIF